MVPDFTGYVTKSGIKCSDGRTIMAHAFKGNDGQKVPLVWQHQHNSAENVLGHVILHNRDDGTWGEGFFNETPQGIQAKALVHHKDIKSLSIYANKLVQQAMNVVHGVICEVSLVLAGANPGAFIDNVNIAHGDSVQVLDDEAVIYSGEELEHAASSSTTVPPPKQVGMPKGKMPTPSKTKAPTVKPSASNPDPDGDGDNDLFDPADGGLGPDATVQDVIDTMTPEQKNVLYALIGSAADSTQQSSTDPTDPDQISHDQKGDTPVTRNVFDRTDPDKKAPTAPGATLTHSDIRSIFDSAHKSGSLKQAAEEYALSHGIDDVSSLFPYDQAVTTSPDFISRRMQWVAGVLNSCHKTPFSRIRSWAADITIDEARAKGYVKAGLKREEFFRISRRVTTPQTIYKKQKLDRDDILDITDFDVVQWLQTEMRIMLDEELARAILIGDGRDVADQDKINTIHVRPIYGDDEMYATPINVSLTTINASAQGPDAIIDGIINGMQYYYGSGDPVFYTSLPWLSRMLLIKDTLGRRLYPTKTELAAALGVSDVIPCQAMESLSSSVGLIGIVVNLTDYTVGADKGGQVSMFDFFDIDYNQFKYLMETRVSGALTKYRSALVVSAFSGSGGLLSDPPAPTFVQFTGVVTIPTVTNVTYHSVADDGTVGATLSAGAQTALASGAHLIVRAVPATNYEFSTDSFEWTFLRD